MTKIKICGLKSDRDIAAVNELLPEFAGFVFWDKSKRYVTADEASFLKQGLDKRIKAVGVFVDEDMETVMKLLDREIINVVQLHGNEGEAYIHRLKAETGCEIIRAFKIRNFDDVQKANTSCADMVLLDSGMGTGESFDWKFINAIERQYILAGGLSPENVGEAVKNLKPYGVDASSLLETDGVKDPAKMQKFVEEVRNIKY